MNVRCCCKPCLVLGRIDVPREFARIGMAIAFELQPREWRPGDLPARDRLTLRVGEFVDAEGNRELALRSDDTPIETLRLLKSFEEVNQIIDEARPV